MLGPQAIHRSRTDYNLAIQRTSDEQLLLNLVRLRYRDRPLFLEVTGLTTQFRFEPRVSAGFYQETGGHTSTQAEAQFEYEEKPTVSYTPLRGKEFVQRMMTPVSWRTLDLLDNVGWRSDRVLRVCVQKLNGLGNAVTASGPTPDKAPPFRTFLEAVRLYQSLREKEVVASYQAKADGQLAQFIAFDARASDLPEYRRFTRLLGLDPAKRRYRITVNAQLPLPNHLQLQTRSVTGILYFLSQGVDVPPEDVAAGRVTLTRDEEGHPFDWSEVLDGLIRIHYSRQAPDNAAVKVRYRGHWFYIDDSDLDSKSTFMLLGQLFALQSGELPGGAPVLTLPVGN